MTEKDTKTVLVIVGVVLLVSLTVLVNIIISNEVKRGRFIGFDSEHVRTIDVKGEGKVLATPDSASVHFGVITSSESSEEALEENNAKATSLIAFLKSEGVEERNIQTTGVNVRPVYDRDPDFISERRIIRYEVSNRVEVKIEDIDNVGTIVDGAVREGADNVTGLRFSVSDEEKLKEQAREEAVQDAREKAEGITSALGVRLGRVMSFSESRDYGIIYRAEMALDSLEGELPEKTPIEPGEDEVEVTVTITFEII